MCNKRETQSILAKINFVCRFISIFVEIVNPIQEMIKKDENYKWTKERKETFVKIKESIVEDPTRQSPDFEKELYHMPLLLIIQSRL